MPPPLPLTYLSKFLSFSYSSLVVQVDVEVERVVTLKESGNGTELYCRQVSKQVALINYVVIGAIHDHTEIFLYKCASSKFYKKCRDIP